MFKAAEARTASKIRKILRTVTYMEEPVVSELLFRPDFMVNMEKQLVLVEVIIPRSNQNVDWLTLRLMEYLFETKMFLGNKSVFVLVTSRSDFWKPYCLEILENFFDRLVFTSDIKTISDIYAPPKPANFRLWDLERDFKASRYKDFSEADLRQFQYQDISSIELKNQVNQTLANLNLFFNTNYGVPNLKNYYLKRNMNLKFYFDFFVDGKIVEIKSFKRINIVSIQDLLIKARLIRYRKINDVMKQIETNKMVLLINGNISGPDYDQFRYLRMLTTAGWDVYPFSILGDKRRARKVLQSA